MNQIFEYHSSEQMLDEGNDMYVLCLDGGGSKGKIISTYLVQLEKYLKYHNSKQNKPYPLEDNSNNEILEKFDVFGGTSSGSVISSAFTYVKMSAQQIFDTFSQENVLKSMPQSIMDKIFGFLQFGPKYDGVGKSEFLRKFLSPNIKMKDTNKITYMTGFDPDKDTPLLFNNCDHPSVKVIDVVEVSTSAPAYYPAYPNPLDGTPSLDGAVWANDPAMAVYCDLKQKFPKRKIKLLSVGFSSDTNYGKYYKNWGGLQWVLSGSIINAISQGTRKGIPINLQKLAESMGDSYLRVEANTTNVSLEIDSVDKKSFKMMEIYGNQMWNQSQKDIKLFFDGQYIKEVEVDVYNI